MNIKIFIGFYHDWLKGLVLEFDYSLQMKRNIHAWCAALRLAFVSYWTAKVVPYLQIVDEIEIEIFDFYQYSASRYAIKR